MKTKLLQTIGALLAALLLTGTAYARVSIDEIIRLHQRGLSAQSLLLVVEASDTPDTISVAQLNDLLDAQVPDTVITMLVAQADAVMEDWQPVDVDEAVQDYQIVTKTRYVYVDDTPDWNVSVGFAWGYPRYYSYWYSPLYVDYVWDPFWDPWDWGWCGSPYYYYYYQPWHYNSGIYVNIGWYSGGWYPYGYGYYGGYWGGHHHHDYWDYHHHDGTYWSYRNVDRPHYRNSVYRSTVEGSTDKTYRNSSFSSGGTAYRDVSGRRATTDLSNKMTDGKRVRTDKDVTPGGNAGTRERKVLTDEQQLTRNDKKLDKRTDRALQNKSDTKRSIFDRDQTVTRKTTNTETRAQKIDRYKKSVASQRSIYSRDNRTTRTQSEVTTRKKTQTIYRAEPAQRERSRSTETRRVREPERTTPRNAPKAEPQRKSGDSKRELAPPKKSDRSSSTRSVRPSAPQRSTSKAAPSRSSSGKTSGKGTSRKPR